MPGRELGRLTLSRRGLRAYTWAQGTLYPFLDSKDTPHSLYFLVSLFVPFMANETDKISWNRNLSRARAVGMGGEFRTKGANVFLGPVVSPLGRTVTSGRNWEGT